MRIFFILSPIVIDFNSFLIFCGNIIFFYRNSMVTQNKPQFN
nr:MAG TPA: hypothetical protein [Caudoviricetes sp.]